MTVRARRAGRERSARPGGRRHPRWGGAVGLAVVLALAAATGAAGCSDDDTGEEAAPTSRAPSATSGSTTTAAPTTTAARPAGPASDLSETLSGGEGVFIGSATLADLEAAGYVEEELVAAGTATDYLAEGERPGDGRWTFAPGEEAPYRTRVLVRRPADPEQFSGTVVVEWLNVSGGVDADPEFANIREEIMRAGHAWVGVSAQLIGVEGGPVLVTIEGIEGSELQGKGLKAIDPERYGSLQHPGDGFSFDIFTQVARALRAGDGLGGVEPRLVIAAGESQSAAALVTYYNGVQPLTEAFDGFLVHSRGAGALPLAEPGGYADIAGAIGEGPTTFRTDLPAPVLDVQAEGDVTSLLNSYLVRQPDSDTFRLWEIAGAAHADANLVGPNAAAFDCGLPINDGPMHLVMKAALRALVDWLETGEAPPRAPRLEVDPGPPPTVQRDADGIALGGIRTPPVDVPVVVLSGEPGPNPSTICLLSGSMRPLAPERLAELYASRDDYLERFEAAADEAIAAGFVLEDDRDALMEFADPSAIPG